MLLLRTLIASCFAALCLTFSSSWVSSQQLTEDEKKAAETLRTVHIPVPCNDATIVLNNIHKIFREEMMLVGDYDEEDRTQTIIFYNKTRKQYTIVELMWIQKAGSKNEKEQIPVACVIASGSGSFSYEAFLDKKVSLPDKIDGL